MNRIINAMAVSIILAAAGSPAVTTTGGSDFERYRVIIDRKPFGEIVPAETAGAAATSAPTESLTKELELRSIIDPGTGPMYATFLDKKTNKYISLKAGEKNDPYELLSINYDSEEAVLKKGAEMTIFNLKSNKTAAASSVPTTPATPFGGSVPHGFTPLAPSGPAPQGFTPVTSPDSKKPFFADVKKRKFSPFKPVTTNTASPFQPQSMEGFMKPGTNAMQGFPGAVRPFQPLGGTNSRGDTIDTLLRANPAGAGAFSPFKPPTPAATPAAGQPVSLEGFLAPNADQAQPQAPAALFPEPAPEDGGEAEE